MPLEGSGSSPASPGVLAIAGAPQHALKLTHKPTAPTLTLPPLAALRPAPAPQLPGLALCTAPGPHIPPHAHSPCRLSLTPLTLRCSASGHSRSCLPPWEESSVVTHLEPRPHPQTSHKRTTNYFPNSHSKNPVQTSIWVFFLCRIFFF